VLCVADLSAWRAWRRLSAWLHVEPPLAHDRPQAGRSHSLCAGRRCERGRTCESLSRVRPATTPARRDASSCASRDRRAAQPGCGVSTVERTTRRRRPDRRRCRPQPVGLSPTFTPPRAGSRAGGSTDASFGYELIRQDAPGSLPGLRYCQTGQAEPRLLASGILPDGPGQGQPVEVYGFVPTRRLRRLPALAQATGRYRLGCPRRPSSMQPSHPTHPRAYRVRLHDARVASLLLAPTHQRGTAGWRGRVGLTSSWWCRAAVILVTRRLGLRYQGEW
jgi:hypothetical protein